MKKTLIIFLILITTVLCTLTAQVEFTRELFESLARSKNPVPNIRIPKSTRVRLRNGMIVYIAQDSSLPVVEITGYIRGGKLHETRENAGITSFMLSMMTTGTKTMDETEYAEHKALNGLSFGFSMKDDFIEIRGSALSIDAEKLFALMDDTMRNPDFEAPYFRRNMMNTRRGLMQAKTTDSSLLKMYYSRLVYGDHPYAYYDDLDLQLAALNSFTPETLTSHYAHIFAPNNTIITIVGDINVREVRRNIERLFNDWQRSEITVPKRPVVPQKGNYGKIVLINKKDATQAKIQMGMDFYNNEWKDQYSFRIANRVFGSGGFSSRLIESLRVEKGYVYSAYSGFNLSNFGGDYFIFTEVEPVNIALAKQAILDDIQDIRGGTRPITQREIFETVNLFNSIFPKYYNTTANILDSAVFNREMRGRSANFINTIIKYYNRVDEKTAQRLFIEHVRPEKFITVILGNKEHLLPVLEEAGLEVDVIELR